MQLLVAGDTHGNALWWIELIARAKANRCRLILQLGDFGYWEHTPRGMAFLDDLSRLLVRARLKVIWIDGNHENHALLRQNYVGQADQDEDGFWQIRPNLFYASRGHRWSWDGISFLALGGGYSIDKEPNPVFKWPGRTPGFDWWPEELISDEDVSRCVQGGPVDILVSHDAPDGVEIPVLRGQPNDLYPESYECRQQVRRVVKAVRPRLVLHGHYHCRYSSVLRLPYESGGNLEWWETRIEGFDRDPVHGHRPADNWAVLDTDFWANKAIPSVASHSVDK